MTILSVTIRVVCREGYFGPDCGCSPRNDSTGHFTCAANGTIVCLPGYQNPETNCTEVEGTTQEPTNRVITQPQSSTTNMEDETMTTMDTTGSMAATPSIGMDIIPIVAGGVAGGLVLLMLILIVNIVLVVLFVRSRIAKDRTENRGNDSVFTLCLEAMYTQ